MQWKFWKKNEPKRPISKLREWLDAATFAVVVATLFRWSVAQAFVIPTPSMENSLLVGDYLLVSKLHYGAMTPRTPLQIPLTHQKIWGTNIPAYLKWIQLPSYRLPAFSEVKREDVVVFFIPPNYLNDNKHYPVDLKTNYVKRCVGIAGDRIEIINRQVYANGQPLSHPEGMKFAYIVTSKTEIHPRNLSRLGLDHNDYHVEGFQNNVVAYKMLMTDAQVDEVKKESYVLTVTEDYRTHDGADPRILPASMNKVWNGDNFGPLVVPKEGMKMIVNDSTLGRYGEIIQLYDGHKQVIVTKDQLIIDGQPVKEYTFLQDYYFMMGDNRHDSWDSRYWGFVPKDHIVGKAVCVWFSIDDNADWLRKIRWSRIGKGIHSSKVSS